MKIKMLFLIFLALQVLNAGAQAAFQVDVKGQGEPVLLFPGFGCTGEVWKETVSRLSQTHECHIFTFAGFGNVPPVEMPWLEKIKDDIVHYVKDHKLKKPILLGHSLGGTLSLWLGILEQDMFKKIILVDALPASAALMIPNYSGEIIPYNNPQSEMMLNMDSSAFANMNLQSIPYMCFNKEKQQTILNWMCMADRKTYVYGYIDMLNLDLRKEIAAIKIPVDILAATSPDLASVQKTYQMQYKNLPGVNIHYAENSAHFVMYDQPEWFIEKVTEVIR
ncbi:MAG TPA: alpha/beta hydrolase [Ohtaekwangia sp.]|nr:alpha/beta hydrolase [Ohtaekwangia sp.]